MNQLPLQKRVQIITLLVEGNSIRSITRILDISKNTVTKYLVQLGRACEKFHDENVRNLNSKKIQADEIWSFVGCKDKNATPEKLQQGQGDAWTWTAIDADSKLIVSWAVGSRTAEVANEFMLDVASRLKTRVQLTTDGLHAYLEATTNAFGSQIDFAQLVKIYGTSPGANSKTEQKYSPAKIKSIEKKVICGEPDEFHISTSYVERSNLTMRMHMRRFTRLTNAFSKKLENHCHAIALHFVYYNFVKIHKSLRVAPAMEAGLIKRVMTIEDIANLVPDPIAKKRGNYKKRDLSNPNQ
ncbi:MAG: IS1 family transposase [Ferruginibacter sp.]